MVGICLHHNHHCHHPNQSDLPTTGIERSSLNILISKAGRALEHADVVVENSWSRIFERRVKNVGSFVTFMKILIDIHAYGSTS